ncbi:MAG: hypothetical protein V4539_03865 [Bacteroidota bacterium]
MKYSICLILCYLTILTVHGQRMSFADSARLSDKVFKKTINQQFSNLVTGQSKTSIGNFASIDLREAEVSFAGSRIFDSGRVMTIKTSGAVSDGLYSIFSNSKLNTQVSLDIKLHFLRFHHQILGYDFDSLVAYDAKYEKLNREYQARALAIKYRVDSVALDKKLRATEKTINTLETLLAISSNSAMVKDSLTIELGTTKILRDSIVYAINTLPSENTGNRINTTARTLARDALAFQAAVNGFKFGWFTVGYKVNKNDFKFCDPSLAFELQVMDSSFVTHEASFQFSHYKWSEVAYQSKYWDIGMSLSVSDNFGLLKKKEISETTNLAPVAGVRSITNKYNVYQGNYKRNLIKWKGYADVYYFLFENNLGALHFYPEWVIQKSERPLFNFGSGFLFSFKDAKTDGAIVNAELYYNFLDIFNSTEAKEKLFERNDIGIRFTFPIQFK